MTPLPVQRIGPRLAWYEQRLAHEEALEDEEKTLFLQLTGFELTLVQFGLYLVSVMYGPHSVYRIAEKIHNLIETQEFCDCDVCRAKRAEEEGV